MKPIIRPELFNLKSEPDYYNCGEHGNCFHTAFVLFLQLVVGNTLEPDFEDAWLCHGTVKLIKKDARIIHGWVEAKFIGCEDVVCFDASAVGQKMTICNKRQYYRSVVTQDDFVSRYDFAELMAISELSKHAGIWEPPRAPVIDDLDDTKLIDAEHWPTIRAKRGSLSGEAALEAIADLRERLKHMEMEPA